MRAVDLSGWQKEEMYSPYPEGARDKYAIISPDNPDDERIVPQHRYLMKFSNNRYPTQFWSEIIAYEIGRRVGVPVPPCFYAEDPQDGRAGSLSQWFFGESLELGDSFVSLKLIGKVSERWGVPESSPLNYSDYIAGSVYMMNLIVGYDLKTGRQHNLKSLSLLVRRFSLIWEADFWDHWVRVLTFDALIGNTDRHQDNWGVLWRSDDGGGTSPRFSPAFDNGTSLLHEIIDSKLKLFDSSEHVARYVGRGTHHLRFDKDDPKPRGHVDLIRDIINYRPTYSHVIRDILSADWQGVFYAVHGLCQVRSALPLTASRVDAIFKVIEHRLSLIRSIV